MNKSHKESSWYNLPSSIGSLFIDSGAHSLYNKHVLKASKGIAKGKGDYSYYNLTPGSEFRQYVDEYAQFIKEYGKYIDFYANVDAIFNPTLTWKIQEYLEQEHGLRPVPVIHCGADLSWFEKYLDKGYRYIGIGGLGQGVSKRDFLEWGDRVFSLLCPGPGRLPVIRTHGFAIMSWELLVRYPWFSVDSASWLKAAAYGQVYIPRFSEHAGEFRFDRPPIVMSVSDRSPNREKRGRHLMNIYGEERRILDLWVKHCGVALRTTEDQRWGAITDLRGRARINLLYFHELAKHLLWPRRFEIDCKALFTSPYQPKVV